MKSEESAISGHRARIPATISRYSLPVYRRFMRDRMRSEPDCAGRCR